MVSLLINYRKPFSDKDNEAMEVALKSQKAIKIPVGQDKLFEVDMAQREYYPGALLKRLIQSVLGRPYL